MTAGPPVIVCGVDDAPGAVRPLRLAADLAKRLRCGLVVVHASPPLLPSVFPPAEAGALTPAPAYVAPMLPGDVAELDERRDALRRRIEHLAEQCRVGEVEIVVEWSASPAELLRTVAANRAAELIVVGSRGRGAIRAALLGSTSHALAGDAPCPVVVVPSPD